MADVLGQVDRDSGGVELGELLPHGRPAGGPRRLAGKGGRDQDRGEDHPVYHRVCLALPAASAWSKAP